jgi:hypothetical protein
LENETFSAMSFQVDKSVNLRTWLDDLALQYSLSLSVSLCQDKEVSCYYHRLICI